MIRLIAFLFVFSCLHGVETSNSYSIASFENPPSTLIRGKVSVITGAFIESEEDLVVPCPAPIGISRTFAGCTGVRNNPWGNWHQSMGGVAEIHYDQTEQPTKVDFLIGNGTLYRCQKGERDFRFTMKNNNEGKGITNLARGMPSGRTNLKNTYIDSYAFKQNEVWLRMPWGSRRHFINDSLREEFFPNGSMHFLELAGNNVSVTAYSPGGLPMGSMTMRSGDFKGVDNPNIHVQSYDGRAVFYHFFPVKMNKDDKELCWYIDEVRKTFGPTIKYAYDSTPDPSTSKQAQKNNRLKYNCFLKETRLPDNRYIKISRYVQGWKPLPGEASHYNFPLTELDDWRSTRVSFLEEPLGSGPEPVVSYRFVYKHLGKSQRNFDSGETDVFDAHGILTRYRYDNNERLTSVQKFTSNPKENTHLETLKWGEKDTPREGLLISHLIMEQPQKNLIEASGELLSFLFGKGELKPRDYCLKHYKYDTVGNVVEESLWGSITGRSFTAFPPNIDENGIVIQQGGAESYKKSFTYSQDLLYLVTSETLPSGQKTTFRYHPNTDLISAKLVSDGAKVLQRQFNRYDVHNLLIETVEDNGCGDSVENWEGVSQRLIKRYSNIISGGCFGSPQEIQTLMADPESQTETLLNREELSYALDGKMTRRYVYDSENTLRFTEEWDYDGWGRCVREKIATGEVIERAFDQNSNMLEERGPLIGHTKRFAYDFMNRCIMEEEIFPEGERFVTTHTYDLLNRKTSTTDPFGHTTHFSYDDFSRLAATTLPYCADEFGQLSRGIIHQNYDVFSNVTEKSDAMGHTVRTRYNMFGKPLEVTFPDGTQEKCFYDQNGFLEECIAKNGTSTKMSYNGLGQILNKTEISSDGQILNEEHYVYDGLNCISFTDGEGNETKYAYDAAGRRIKEEKGRQLKTFSYDSLGFLEKTITWDGSDILSVLIQKRDIAGRIVEETIQDQNGTVFQYQSFSYDVNGNVISHQIGDSVWQFGFDAHRRPLWKKDPLGNLTRWFYDFDYRNELGQRVLHVTEIDPLGQKAVTIHDTLGRARKTTRLDPFDFKVQEEQKDYDLAGYCIRLTKTLFGRDQVKDITEWTYDTMGRLIERREGVGASVQRSVYITYNEIGQRELITKSSGIALEQRYNSLGNLEEVKSSDGSIDYIYTYDRRGLVTQIVEPLTGRVTQRSYSPEGWLTRETLNNNLTTLYSYNSAGCLEGVSFPDGSSVTYKHNPINISQVIRKRGNELWKHSYNSFDLAGELLEEALADGTKRQWSYDSAQHLTSIVHPQFSQTKISYDPVGQITSFLLKDRQGELERTFNYDTLSQLIKESGGPSHTFAYDSAYNRVAKDDVACEIDPLGQLMSQGDLAYIYDLDGRVIKKQSSKGTFTFQYDAYDRMTKVLTPDGAEISYAYDPFHRRTFEWQNGKEEKYLYQLQNEVGKMVDGHCVEFRTLGIGSGAEIGASVLIELKGKTFIPHHDHAGNIVALTQNGRIIDSCRYSAFGEIADGALWSCPWGFSSKRLCPRTQLIFFGQRTYDPETGRWLSKDPLGEKGGPNHFTYVNNNPLIFTDSYGLYSELGYELYDEYDPFHGAKSFTETAVGYFVNDYYETHHIGLPIITPARDKWVEAPITYKSEGWSSNYSAVSFINGMNTSYDEARQNVNHLQKLIGGHEVRGVHNPNIDIIPSVQRCRDELSRAVRTKSMDALIDLWKDMVTKLDENGIILHFCHSEGAIITRNALIYLALTHQDLYKRIKVVAIAPAAKIFSKFVFGVTHYESNDFIPLLDKSGNEREKHTIVKLSPHPSLSNKEKSFDHSFMSPTYEEAISDEWETYNKDVQNRRISHV